MDFLSYHDFVERTSNYDCQFIARPDAEENIYESIYAMSNGEGGYIVIGADEEKIYGVDFDFRLNSEKLRGLKYEIQELNRPARIIIIYVEPLEFYERPMIFKGRIYRRVEGINLISSIRSARYMAMRQDDEPEKKERALNETSVKEFHEAIIKRRPELKIYSREEFLRRSFIYSGRNLMREGFLMLGNDSAEITAELKSDMQSITLKANNLWSAYFDMLPRLISRLSYDCARALFEMFMNALIHSDYKKSGAVTITITGNPPACTIINSGLAMSFKRAALRNFRLMKIFKLLGAVRGSGLGIEIIKNYSPEYKIMQDMLNFKTISRIPLKAMKELPSPVIL